MRAETWFGPDVRVGAAAIRAGHRDGQRWRQLCDRVFPGYGDFGSGEANRPRSPAAGITSSSPNTISNGASLWAKTTSGAVAGGAFGIATDSAGNSYVTGGFSARRRSAPARPTRLRSPPRASRIFSSPSTIRAARWSGPSMLVEPALIRAWPSRRTAPATATLPGISRHSDVRRRRGQRDHAHQCGQQRDLRRQVLRRRRHRRRRCAR